MRILFMGTPDFAVPPLRSLAEAGHEICGVFTRPDRPKNRGMKLQATPVKEFALTHNIPVYQPVTLKGDEPLALVRSLAPDLTVVAAYGRILPREILDAPELGSVNIHASLLPKYRGAAPVNQAVLCGETETGVTIMAMAPELDAGDILCARSTAIGPEETAEELYPRLAELGAQLIVEAVADLAAGTAVRTPQNHAVATYAPMLTRAMSPVDWNRSAAEIHNQIRGLCPWPGASTDAIGGTSLKLWASRVLAERTDAAPGTVLKADREGIDLSCGDGLTLRVIQVQAPGGRRMAAADYLRGHPVQPGV